MTQPVSLQVQRLMSEVETLKRENNAMEKELMSYGSRYAKLQEEVEVLKGMQRYGHSSTAVTKSFIEFVDRVIAERNHLEKTLEDRDEIIARYQSGFHCL